MKVYDLHDDMVELFFATAVERYRILLRRREGKSQLTNDPVMANWFFCNVFREDDVTTQFFKETIREPMHDRPEVIQWMMLCRLFNRIEPIEAILNAGLFEHWDWYDAADVVKDIKPIVGGAYRVRTPKGMNKAEGVLKIAYDNWNPLWQLGTRIVPGQATLESTWSALSCLPYLANVVSYEIVSDLRHTYMLERASDINTWAAPTAGVAAGMSWLVARDPKFFYHEVGQRAAEAINNTMLRLIALSRYDGLWPQAWPAWEMRDVAHWLTQYGAYCKAHFQEKMLHRRYPVVKKRKI